MCRVILFNYLMKIIWPNELFVKNYIIDHSILEEEHVAVLKSVSHSWVIYWASLKLNTSHQANSMLTTLNCSWGLLHYRFYCNCHLSCRCSRLLAAGDGEWRLSSPAEDAKADVGPVTTLCGHGEDPAGAGGAKFGVPLPADGLPPGAAHAQPRRQPRHRRQSLRGCTQAQPGRPLRALWSPPRQGWVQTPKVITSSTVGWNSEGYFVLSMYSFVFWVI